MCHNVLGDPSQNNFLQQPQQQAPQPQHQQLQRQQAFNQSMQRTQCATYPINQQGPYGPPQCQPDVYSNIQQITNAPAANPFQAPYRGAYDAPVQNLQSNNVSLPPGLLEQIRACMAPPPGPIFILPSNTPPVIQTAANCPTRQSYEAPPAPSYYPSCYPYPFPMPIPFNYPGPMENKNCTCCPKKSADACKTLTYCVDNQEHRCEYTTDDTVCTKKNCPSSISLQALASQLLAIQGVISCAATRLVLRKVPGSNITNNMDETIGRARKTINVLTQDQLLAEARNAQQVNALINLHMTANPPQNIIPILTTIQLKVNLLKSQVECLINRRLTENQCVGAEGNTCFDAMTLSLKSDEELRTLLATLRQKECDERVNYNFAPYHSQRAIAECRLRNVESKINQIEREMERRRYATLPRTSLRCDDVCDSGGIWHAYPGTLPGLGTFGRDSMGQPQRYESPDPFQIDVTNPRRLNLVPHVGSPETSYNRPSTLVKETTSNTGIRHGTAGASGSGVAAADGRVNDNEDDSKNGKHSEMDCECNCDCKSSDDESDDGAKKKLRFEKDVVDHVDANVPDDKQVVKEEKIQLKLSCNNDEMNIVNKNIKNELNNPQIISLHNPAMIYREDSDNSLELGDKIDDDQVNVKVEYIDKLHCESIEIEYCQDHHEVHDVMEKKGNDMSQETLHTNETYHTPDRCDKENAETNGEGVEPVQKHESHTESIKEDTTYSFSTKSTEIDLHNDDKNGGNFVFGTFSIIGNHVSSFSSIIEKISNLTSHLMSKNSLTLIDSLSNNSVTKNAHSSTMKKSVKNDMKSINKTKYHLISSKTQQTRIPIRIIRLDKINNYTKTSCNDGENGMNESLKAQSTLLIRSKLNNSQSTFAEQLIPFNVVAHENSVLLSSSKSSTSNQSNQHNSLHTLRSSEKFWFLFQIKDSKDDNETDKLNADAADNLSLNTMTKNEKSSSSREKRESIKVKTLSQKLIGSDEIFANEDTINVYDYTAI